MRYQTAIVLMLALTACEAPTSVRHISNQDLATARSDAAPEHLVTGGGQLVGDGWKETYGFTAHADGNGNVEGQVQMMLSDVPWFHAEVTCLAVAGNSAWIGGVVRATQDATQVPIGTQLWFRVQDSGPSASDPDRISFIRLGLPASTCNEKRPVMMPFAWTHGQIVVR